MGSTIRFAVSAPTTKAQPGKSRAWVLKPRERERTCNEDATGGTAVRTGKEAFFGFAHCTRLNVDHAAHTKKQTYLTCGRGVFRFVWPYGCGYSLLLIRAMLSFVDRSEGKTGMVSFHKSFFRT